MNYTLSLNLEGFDNAEKSIDSLMSKVSGLGGPKISFDKWLSAGGEAESAGEKIGKNLGTGIKKSLSLLDFFQKANFKGLKDFWDSAIKQGNSDMPKAEWQGPIDMRGKIKGLREVTGKDLSKVSSLGDIENLSKGVTKGLRDVSGKDLAKVLALPDMNDLTPKMDKLKIAVAGIATLFNPFVGARLLSDAIPKGGMSGGKGVTGAIFGAAGAAGYGEIFVIVKVLETAFKMLTKAVMSTVAAYETARQLYAKSLMQGLGLNFTAKRGMIASVLGVSETEVLRFGAAMNYLNPKLAFAADTLAKTAVPLTGVAWEFKILEENIKAIWAQVANGMSPAIGALLENLNAFIVSLGKMHVFEGIAMLLNSIAQKMVNAIGVFEILVSGIVLGLKEISSRFVLMIVDINNAIAGTKIGKAFGFSKEDDSGVRKDLDSAEKGFSDLVGTVIKNWNGKHDGVPQPMAQMKQLPASAWEKMGLVIGGGSSNYAKDTAKNTKDTVNAIKMLNQTVAKISASAGGFGYSPFTAQP